MTALTAPALEYVGTDASRVVAEAKRTWDAHGEPVEVGITAVTGQAHLASLAALNARRVEYVIDSDNELVWEALKSARHADKWQLCALVPLALMGRAHEHLCENRFELQGWWFQGDRVAFGGIEIA